MDKKTIIAPSVVINSMRDNGYKNAAYALAEIVDNSIQAGSDSVKILSYEHSTLINNRTYKKIQTIAVLDNGCGMNEEDLYSALVFGESTHKNDKSGMGKFGMGLPNSSISQCKRVEVWSWKNLDSINYTYLDIDEIIGGNEHIPFPRKKDIPMEIEKSMDEPLPSTGTLVVWTKLDKLQWSTSKTLLRHSELKIGRMYRNFIENKKVTIRFLSYEVSANGGIEKVDPSGSIRANDPMYLTPNSTFTESLPAPYENESFFQINEDYTKEFEFNNAMHEIRFRSSYPKKHIWESIRHIRTSKVGSTLWGKHCDSNFGLSIMRAGRELDIDPRFITWNLSKFRDLGRFCGLEVEFPPSLDMAFGVLNNKQQAVHLKPMDKDKDAEFDGYKDSTRRYLSDLKDGSSGKDIMYGVVSEIITMRNNINEKLKTYNTANNIHEPAGVLTAAGKITSEGAENREKDWETEFGETTLLETDVANVLVESGTSIEEAEITAKDIVDAKEKYHIVSKPLATDAFFDVTTKNGFALIQINENHSFYKKLLCNVGENERTLLEVTLGAWARLEHETQNADKRRSLEIYRIKWGEILDGFFMTSEE